MPYDVLVVDDEADIRDLICDALEDEGYSTRKAKDGIAAFESINDRVPTVVILDIWLQGSELDGLGILEIIKQKYPNLPVVMISGHGTIETAVKSIKMGAYDYVEKPFTEDKLLVVVKRACEMNKLSRENAELRSKARDRYEMVASTPIMIQLRNFIDKVSPTSGRVMITGPSGSGKELVARLIHKKSKRANDPFVMLNVAGMSPERMQIELFGEDEKFSISDRPRKMGLFELANNGTLFIDEVSDLHMAAQNKILRFLQDQSFERQGTNRLVKLDVRIISSTSKDLQREIEHGRFRQDLFYRLNVIPIKVPPLTERREDIPLLCSYFMKYLEETSGLQSRPISEEAMVALQAYSWPGNVRQLKNILEWLLIMTQGGVKEAIRASMLPPEIISNSSSTQTNMEGVIDMMSMPLREAREMFEKQYLAAQMTRFNGNISRTSAFVGMERSALHRKLKSLNIHSGNNGTEESELESSQNPVSVS